MLQIVKIYYFIKISVLGVTNCTSNKPYCCLLDNYYVHSELSQNENRSTFNIRNSNPKDNRHRYVR